MFCGGFGRGFLGSSMHSSAIGFGLMPFMMIFRLLILIAIIIFAVRFFKGYYSSSQNALKILDESFAKGDLSEEEYIKRKTILTKRN